MNPSYNDVFEHSIRLKPDFHPLNFVSLVSAPTSVFLTNLVRKITPNKPTSKTQLTIQLYVRINLDLSLVRCAYSDLSPSATTVFQIVESALRAGMLSNGTLWQDTSWSSSRPSIAASQTHACDRTGIVSPRQKNATRNELCTAAIRIHVST